jgi:hypothetical protein
MGRLVNAGDLLAKLLLFIYFATAGASGGKIASALAFGPLFAFLGCVAPSPPPFEGARNARGGERQFAAVCGLAESNLHLFEPVQLLL